MKIRLMQLISISKMAVVKEKIIRAISQSWYKLILEIISWRKSGPGKAKNSKFFLLKQQQQKTYSKSKHASGLFCKTALMDSAAGVKAQTEFQYLETTDHSWGY